MALKNLTQRDGKWIVWGEPQKCFLGRDSFKLAAMLSRHFMGEGGWESKAYRWIEHNQRLLGEHCILRVFGETGDWAGHQMFGSEPADAGIWNIAELQQMVAEGRKLRRLTSLNMKVIEWLMQASHMTGVCFEYVVDATLKHTDGLTTPITDNAIRITAAFMRVLSKERFPDAVIILEGRNEWRAHNKMRTKVNEVNMWAQRFHRWKNEHGTTHSYTDPGGGYVAEQWPESYIIEDESSSNLFSFDVGLEPQTFDMGCIHPDRGGEWWRLPSTMEQLRRDCRRAPLGFNESMLYCDREDTERVQNWYGTGGWTIDLGRYRQWLDACKGDQGVDYFIIHDEKGMQCDPDWPRPLTRLEDALGGSPPPPPPPPTGWVSYERIIRLGFVEILDRQPDPGAMVTYQELLAEGMTEAQFREALLRSDEYKEKNGR